MSAEILGQTAPVSDGTRRLRSNDGGSCDARAENHSPFRSHAANEVVERQHLPFDARRDVPEAGQVGRVGHRVAGGRKLTHGLKAASGLTLKAVLAALESAGCKPKPLGSEYQALCPAHEDHNPSLSIKAGDTQPVVLRCHAGCRFKAIIASLNLDRPLRVMDGGKSTRPPLGDPVEVYDYGTYEVCRYAHPKTFRQRRPDGKGGYIWSTKGIAPRLYHEDELRDRVVIVEGEKDVDRLRAIGWSATTHSGGAAKAGAAPKWKPAHTKILTAAGVKTVIVIPDTDDTGRAHGQAIVASCHAVGITVEVIDLPAPHKDVSEFLDAGGDVKALADTCKAAPACDPSDAPAAPVARLEPITEFTPEPTQWVIPGWLAAGEFHLLAGQAGMGKSTLATKIAAMVSRSQDFNGEPCAGGDVALWSGEDDYNKTLLPRLLVNGADPAHVHFVRTVDDGDDAPDFNPANHMPALAQALENKPGLRLVILDPILSIAARVRDSYRPEDIRQCLLPVQRLARAHGVALLGITHFLKRHNATGSDPLDRVIGSQAWGAVARIVWVVDRLDDGGRGLMRAKSNLGPSAGGYTYQLVEKRLPTDDPNGQPVAGLKVSFPRILAGEAADVFRTAAATPGDKDRETARDSAADWLKDYLSEHARPWGDVTAAGKTNGFTEHTLRRARDMLRAAGIVRGTRGGTQAFVWSLVASGSSSPREDG